jgi:hypothetical protein
MRLSARAQHGKGLIVAIASEKQLEIGSQDSIDFSPEIEVRASPIKGQDVRENVIITAKAWLRSGQRFDILQEKMPFDGTRVVHRSENGGGASRAPRSVSKPAKLALSNVEA